MTVSTELSSSEGRPPRGECLKNIGKIGSLVLGVGGYFIPAEPGSTRAATLGRWVMKTVHAIVESFT